MLAVAPSMTLTEIRVLEPEAPKPVKIDTAEAPAAAAKIWISAKPTASTPSFEARSRISSPAS
jgi:hypothetical protein